MCSMGSTNLSEFLFHRQGNSSPQSRFSPNHHTTSIRRRNRIHAAVWIGADLTTIAVAAFIGILLRGSTYFFQSIEPTPLYVSEISYALYFSGFSLALVFVTHAQGLYRPPQAYGGLHELWVTVKSCLTASLVLAGGLYFGYAQSVSRAVVLFTLFSTTLLLCLRRALWRIFIYSQYENEIGTKNVLIIGAGKSSLAVRNHLCNIRRLGYAFKGFVRIRADINYCEEGINPLEIIGSTAELHALVRQHFVDEVFITGPCSRTTIRDIVTKADELNIDVRVIPDLYEGAAVTAPVEYIGQFPTIPLHFHHVPAIGLIVKRTVDIVVSFCALVLVSPVMLSISLAILLESGSPVFYRAERVGRKGRIFNCWKFRSMVTNADKLREDLLHKNERDGILFKVKNDPRITPLGRFLRKYSLDELPQLFNVLSGSMSLVGPRPPLMSEVNQYELAHLRRLDVAPGITGLWQIQSRQDPSFDQYISLDTLYVDTWSNWLDFRILIRTINVVLSGTGS